jgi:inhibitor of cysteine peptidase
MRTKVRAALVLVLATSFILLAGCTGSPDASAAAVKVGEAANGTEVALTIGQTLEVTLPANATTGFDWIYGGPPSQLTSVSDSYSATAPAGVVGAGGTRTFVFKAAAPGTGTLKLDYARSWESVQPEKTFTVTVVVE